MFHIFKDSKVALTPISLEYGETIVLNHNETVSITPETYEDNLDPNKVYVIHIEHNPIDIDFVRYLVEDMVKRHDSDSPDNNGQADLFDNDEAKEEFIANHVASIKDMTYNEERDSNMLYFISDVHIYANKYSKEQTKKMVEVAETIDAFTAFNFVTM